MTAATVNFYIEGLPSNEETVNLTVTDGETYVSRKFKLIQEASACGNEDNDAHINVTISGQTATINYAAMTDQIVTLTLYGEQDS